MKIDARCGGFAIPFSSASLPQKCSADADAAGDGEEEADGRRRRRRRREEEEEEECETRWRSWYVLRRDRVSGQ